jgi:hypothetical protein
MFGVPKSEIEILVEFVFWIGGNSDPGIYMFAEIAGNLNPGALTMKSKVRLQIMWNLKSL